MSVVLTGELCMIGGGGVGGNGGVTGGAAPGDSKLDLDFKVAYLFELF
jgi:hypothetical protein